MFLRGTAAGHPQGLGRPALPPIRLKTAGLGWGCALAGAGYCRGVDGRRASEVVRWGLRTGMEEHGCSWDAAVSDAGLHVDGRENPFGGA